MGGEGQPQAQAALATRIIDFGYDVQQAIEAPRWLMGRTWGTPSRNMSLEGRISDEVVRELKRRGFVRVRHYGLLANRHRQEKLARCRELLGMAVSPQGDSALTDPDPVTPPVHEATVTPTRVCPRCGAGRMVVVADFPPMPTAEGVAVGREPCLILDSS
jgi:hypothetical protein